MGMTAMAIISGASAVDQHQTAKRAEKRAERDKAAGEKKLTGEKKKRSEQRMARGNRAQQRIAAERSILERGVGGRRVVRQGTLG